MSHIIKIDNVAITGVLEGAPPARGSIWTDARGVRHEVIVATQLYETGSGGSAPEPHQTVYVKLCAEERSKRDVAAQAVAKETEIEQLRREYRLGEEPVVIATEADEAAMKEFWGNDASGDTPPPAPAAGGGEMSDEQLRREYGL